MGSGSRRGVALASGGLAGLAIATLVLPELANTLKPTALGIGLLTLVLALLTPMLQRLGECYRRRGEVDGALRAYPPELLRDADQSQLGVNPADSGQPGNAPHSAGARGQPNDQLDQALGASPYVVVRGPAGCGKSRAAAEAAARVWPTLPAIIPFDAAGLGVLQDDDFETYVHPRPHSVCLWLDGLERFLQALDTRALSPRWHNPAVRFARRLTRRGRQEIRVVATIRSDQWDSLRAGTDQESETLRAFEDIATVVSLDDSAQAVAVQPARLQAGDGGSPSAGGGSPPAPRPKPPWWDPLLVVLVAMTAAVGVVIGGLYVSDKKQLVQPPPISDQMAGITSSMETEIGHGHVVLSDRVWLHSTEDESWIIGVQHGPTHAARHAKKLGLAPSDELRIYDVHNGWLDQELDFQPSLVGGQAANLTLIAADSSGNAGLYNNNGTPQFIAGYLVNGRSGRVIVPFGIDWQTMGTASGYKLTGLTENRDSFPHPGPEFSTRRLAASQAAFLETNYGQLVTLHNRMPGADGNRSLYGYPVSAFALTLQPAGRLLLGYLLGSYDYLQTNVLEVGVGQLRSGGLAVVPCSEQNPTCSGPDLPEELHVPPDRDDSQALLDEWPALESHWVHGITVTNA